MAYDLEQGLSVLRRSENGGDPGDEQVVGRVGDLAIVHGSGGSGKVRTAAPQGASRYFSLNLMTGVTDATIVALSMLASLALLDYSPGVGTLVVVQLAVLVWLAVFKGFGLTSPHRLPALDEARRVVGACSLGVVITAAASSFYPDVTIDWLLVLWGLSTGGVLAGRFAWRTVRRRMEINGALALRTLVVGSGEDAARINDLFSTPGVGYVPVGLVGPPPEPGQSSLPHLGGLEDIDEIIEDRGIECLFIVASFLSPKETLQWMSAGRRAGLEVRVSAGIRSTFPSRAAVHQIGDLTTIALRPVRLTVGQAAAKRGFDILASSVALMVALPLILGIALAIKLTSRGPVIFRQKRVTRGGRTFTMYKFRTMVADADRRIEERDLDKSEAFFKPTDEPLITTVGRLLRKASLDEIPQLLNVLKGDMSLVGPRPLPAEQVAANLDLLSPRHEVSSGLTGWWQVNGRSDVDPEVAVALDRFYIENWSLSLDLYILIKTVGVVLFRRGAY